MTEEHRQELVEEIRTAWEKEHDALCKCIFTTKTRTCSAQEATDGLFHPCCDGCNVLGCHPIRV